MPTITANQLAIDILTRFENELFCGGTPEKMEKLRRKVALLAALLGQTFEATLAILREAME